MKQLILLCMLCCTVQVAAFDTTFSRIDRFLSAHVCNGGVAYAHAKNDRLLDTILADYSALNAKEYAVWGKDLQLCMLINLYNCATIKLIVDNYPLKTGIKDIPKAWDKQWINLFGKKVSLNHIEHDLIRKQFNEPRIHCVLVCAARSCPLILDKAYVPEHLQEQFENAARTFLTDTTKNHIDKNKLVISPIFQWYGDDFKKTYGGVEGFIKRYLPVGKGPITYSPYDWSLNDAGSCR